MILAEGQMVVVVMRKPRASGDDPSLFRSPDGPSA